MSSAMFSPPAGSIAQSGGSNPIGIIMNNLDPIPNLIYGVLLILLIAFSYEVPTRVRTIMDSFWGRIIGLIAISASIRIFGWIYGLLAAIAFLLVLRGAPRPDGIEGFHAIEGKEVERPTARWFVERVLGERPIRIENDTILTEAISDNSQNNMTRSGR